MRFIILAAAAISFGTLVSSTYAEAQTGTAGHGYSSRTYQENRSANTQSGKR